MHMRGGEKMDMDYHELDGNGDLVMTVPVKEWKYLSYPETDFVEMRSGFKVGWRTYSTKESAEACSYAAGVNAILKELRGFAFGYQYPSTLTKVDKGWEVVIP